MSYSLYRIICGFLVYHCVNQLIYASPVWIFTPLSATTFAIASNDSVLVSYTITNKSKKIHTLELKSTPSVSQITTGLNVCGNPFVLASNASCILMLKINGGQLTQNINGGPKVEL